MTTVLILGSAAAPEPLRDLVMRGSTSFREQRVDALEAAMDLGADRIVFWCAEDDAAVRRVAGRYAAAEAAARREAIVFVTAEGAGGAVPDGLSPHEIFVWPRDEDRLKMAFLTGA
jgi:hypothetical protein